MNEPIIPPSIPLVGQPGGLRAAYPTMLWECYCKEQPYPLLVLIGIGNPVACPHCQKIWVMTGWGQPTVGYRLPERQGVVQ